MSDRPNVETARNIIRAQLAAAFPGNRRLQSAFENMVGDVAETLPDAIEQTVETATSAQAMASAALALATAALERDVDGPPLIPPAAAPDDAPPVIYDILARLAQLERAVANLKEGPTP